MLFVSAISHFALRAVKQLARQRVQTFAFIETEQDATAQLFAVQVFGQICCLDQAPELLQTAK